MTSLILAAILAGDLHACQVQRVIVKQQVVPVVEQVIQDPYWSYAVGEQQHLEQRLNKLEEVMTLALENQRLLIEGGSGVPSTANPIAEKAKSIFDKRCIACHGGTEPKAGLDLTSKLTPNQKLLVSLMVEDGSMPPAPKKPLSDDEFGAIKEWVAQDKAALRQALRQVP